MSLAVGVHEVIAKVHESDLQLEAERLEKERLERANLRRLQNAHAFSASELLQKLAENAGVASPPEDKALQVRSQDVPPDPKPVAGAPPAFPPPPRGKDEVGK